MSKTGNFSVNVVCSALLFSYLILYINIFVMWIPWNDLFYAVIMAAVSGLIVKNVYDKYSNKSKMLKTTLTPPNNPRKSLAKLMLKDKHEFVIDSYKKIFGREDFLGISTPDDLLYIGKEHFKITKKGNQFYIEDLGTKNGTIVNGKEIRGSRKKKLKNNDDIVVAKILEIKYIEEKFDEGMID